MDIALTSRANAFGDPAVYAIHTTCTVCAPFLRCATAIMCVTFCLDNNHLLTDMCEKKELKKVEQCCFKKSTIHECSCPKKDGQVHNNNNVSQAYLQWSVHMVG